MVATPTRCAALPRFTLRMLICSTILLLAACSGRTTASIAPPTATAGAVTLVLNQANYSSHRAIGVMVSNTSKTAYYAKTGFSACTYVQLEYYDTTKHAWLAVDGCLSVNPPHILLLAPTSSIPITLAPGDLSNDPNAWAPGLYRVSLRYGTPSDGSGTQVVVYSQGFTITS